MKALFLIVLAAALPALAANPAKPPAADPGAAEDALQLEEEKEVQLCYKLPDSTKTIVKQVSPLPDVGKSRKLASGEVWHRERADRICYYPDEKTFGEFQAVQKRFNSIEWK